MLRPVWSGATNAQHNQNELAMNSQELVVQGHRLIRTGVSLFLFTSFEGFAVPYFAVPSLGRSVPTLSAFVGVLFLTLGLLWPRLDLGATASRIACWVAHLLGLGDYHRVCHGRRVGSPQLDYSDCSRRCARQRSSGARHPAGSVFGRPNRHCFLRAHPMGSSR
jgi:hypothetical protein